MSKHSAFLSGIRAYVEANPDVAPFVSDHVASGLSVALSKAYERAADMEVALAVNLARRYPGREKLTLDKLTKWKGQTALDWGWFGKTSEP